MLVKKVVFWNKHHHLVCIVNIPNKGSEAPSIFIVWFSKSLVFSVFFLISNGQINECDHIPPHYLQRIFSVKLSWSEPFSLLISIIFTENHWISFSHLNVWNKSIVHCEYAICYLHCSFIRYVWITKQYSIRMIYCRDDFQMKI